ncbi:DinB family protein [uncultured Dokdonia sp.]|uniref:DinB family protein n=1 Tax=uncultured Dokdonia sp. TaxID=575653 RepID=UPI0030EDF427|tara:strand:+ start:33336 stop:33878 length:543 start_codon:yes stop_codon:yes gene_type:complete
MRQLFILSIILCFSISDTLLHAQETNFINDYIQRLENSQEYLNLVAEAMPSENYSYRVTPESSSFEENLMHIAWAMDWHSESLLNGRPARNWESDSELKIASKTKEEMIAAVNKTFEHTVKLIQELDTTQLNDTVAYGNLQRTKRQVLLILTDHITHHRAQMLVALRLNGLIPPRYMLYQ